jgi:hypothetical protein
MPFFLHHDISGRLTRSASSGVKRKIIPASTVSHRNGRDRNVDREPFLAHKHEDILL